MLVSRARFLGKRFRHTCSRSVIGAPVSAIALHASCAKTPEGLHLLGRRASFFHNTTLKSEENKAHTLDKTENSRQLYSIQKRKEPLLDVADIQGDVILGFNKPFITELVFNLAETKDAKGQLQTLKTWLKTFSKEITSTRHILSCRESRSNNEKNTQVFRNISFGYSCIEQLLKGTVYSDDLNKFDKTSAFVVGAKKRATLLGDDSSKEWNFPRQSDLTRDNNDILINIGADKFEDLDAAVENIIKETKNFLQLVDATYCYRGDEDNEGALYGHEC